MMKNSAPVLLFLLVLCTTHPHIRQASAGRYGFNSSRQVIFAKCDPRGMIPQGSPFWGHLGLLLQLLVDNTPYTKSYYFKTRTGSGDAPAFGEASCQEYTTPARCQACLRQLSSDIWRICNSALGAHVMYPDCWIHYESDEF